MKLFNFLQDSFLKYRLKELLISFSFTYNLIRELKFKSDSKSDSFFFLYQKNEKLKRILTFFVFVIYSCHFNGHCLIYNSHVCFLKLARKGNIILFFSF